MLLGLRRSLSLLGALVLALAVGLPAVAVPAAAAEPTTLALTATSGHADTPTRLVLDLRRTDGTAVGGAQVEVERSAGGAWTPVGTVVSDAAGHAELTAPLSRSAADNTFRARWAGDGTHAPSESPPVTAQLVRYGGKLVLQAPRAVIDERAVPIQVRWTTANGAPVAGPVRLQRRVKGGWRTVHEVVTGADGFATVTERPRTDTRWRAASAPLDWVDGDRSRVQAIDNRPPVEPVRLPRAAPRPRISLPPQRRAVGNGPNVEITRIPDQVWRQMTGITWHRGCPVGRGGLRLVRINYWDYDGYRRRGELVAATGAAGRIAGALSDMYQRRLPIRSMYRVDRFGWSSRVRGGDDYASMAAGNTSAFNCRDVVGRPGVRSPHSWGRSLDVNTWENPFRSSHGLVPNGWWQKRSHPRVAWRSRAHPVVRIMARHGLRWAYGLGDTQHFEARYSADRAAYPRCREYVCD